MPIVKVDIAKALADVKNQDWTALDAMTDEDIARQVAENPDAAPLLAEGEDYSKWTRVRGRPRADRQDTNDGPLVGGTISVVALRTSLKMTQTEFARAYRFSAGAIRAIEQGRRKPSGPTAAFLELIAGDPEYVKARLSKTNKNDSAI